MGYEQIEKNTLNDIADEIITKLGEIDSPFTTPTVVCHNMKVVQWFKAYYLKNNDKVMMNVKFTTLSVFVDDLINPGRKYRVINRSIMRDYILKSFRSKGSFDYTKAVDFPVSYIEEGGKVNGNNLYELADKLSRLFINYELDLVDINGWEKNLYTSALTLAGADKCYSLKALFEMNKGSFVAQAEPVYIINNSYITGLFDEILKEADSENIHVYSLKSDEISIEKQAVISAPSKLREVQAVHTEICKIIRDNSDVRFNDILVYAPAITEYANVIKTVFNQDNKEFPDIPYRIAGEIKEKKDMLDALEVLRSIANKGFFTRNDFYKMVKNSIVRYIWDISDDDIAAWMKAVTATNVYRNNPRHDDWDYFKKRLLLSILVSRSSEYENRASLGGEEYLPYSSMNLNVASINKLIDIVNGLQKWNSIFGTDISDRNFAKAELIEIQETLDQFFSRKNSDGEEKNFMYQSISELMENLIALDYSIPAGTLLQLLSDAPNSYSSSPADLFTGGVAFVSLSANDVVSAKYVFAMGMASANFPRIEIKSELDLTPTESIHKTSQELDRISVGNLVRNAGRIRFSYVNLDLKTEEEFFPSTYITEYIDGKHEVTIDETRDYAELFTKKEYRSKSYFDRLRNEDVAGAGSTATTGSAHTAGGTASAAEIDTVKISEISEYLECSFRYKFNQVLKSYSGNDAEIQDEFEGIELTIYKQSGIVNEIVRYRGRTEIKAELKLRNRVPKGELSTMDIGDQYLEVYYDKEDVFIKELNGYTDPVGENFKINIHGQEINIKNDVRIFKKADRTDLYYLEEMDYLFRNISNTHYLKSYVYALLDVAQMSDGTDYKVHLGPADKAKTFTLDAAKARKIIETIIGKMIDFDKIRYTDFDLITKEEKKRPATFAKLCEHASKKLRYFEDKSLINFGRDLGYDENKFAAQLKEELDSLNKVILF